MNVQLLICYGKYQMDVERHGKYIFLFFSFISLSHGKCKVQRVQMTVYCKYLSLSVCISDTTYSYFYFNYNLVYCV